MADSFIWYELLTSDQDAATAFYTAVVGWTAEDQAMAELDFRYTILSVGERGVAGMMVLTDEMKAGGAVPAWVGVIGVADTDAEAKRIVADGGALLMGPNDIPNVGRFAVVADPGGTAYELMTPLPREEEPAPVARMTPGFVGWHELYAANGEKAAFAFYSAHYGWTETGSLDMGPMGKYRLFAAGGDQAGGMMNKPADMPVGAWGYYFVVDGIDAAVERIDANGGKVSMGPHEVPDGSWIVQATDPQGAHFALVSATR
jgi:predicted enzyme related to lactoylglutathione lyase